MKNPFKTRSKQPAGELVFLCEYRPEQRRPPGFWAYPDNIDHKTHLTVVFDGGTQRRFSSVRIVLYCASRVRKGTWVCPHIRQRVHT